MSSQTELTQKEKSVEEYKSNFAEYKKNYIEKYVKFNYDEVDVNSGEFWTNKLEEYNGCLSTMLEEFFIPYLKADDLWCIWDGEADDPILEGFDVENEDDMEELYDMKSECWGEDGRDVSHLTNWIEENGGIQGLKEFLGLDEVMLK
jgi:hypothetical protein